MKAILWMIMVLVFVLTVSFGYAHAQTFSDVPPGYWAYPYIEAGYAAGLFNGYPDGTFHPEEQVTRDQMAVFLSNALDLPAYSGAEIFPDVPIGYWAFSQIGACYEAGIVHGYWDGYHPKEAVNRAQMAVYIQRAKNLPSYTGSQIFPDVDQNYWAFGEIGACYQAEIVQGYPDGNYKPEETLTRAQMAVFLCRAFNIWIEQEDFVIASGNRLMYQKAGRPYYFSSTNQYYLFYKPLDMVDEVFNDAQAMGINVIRTWGFCDGMDKDGVSFQPEPGVYDETGFARMDSLIKKARDMNMRLIITLVNNWNDFGGMQAYVDWSPTATTHDRFYTDSYSRNLYKDYVEYFLNRVNTLTGVRYKDDPTILIWELANEPRCESDATGNILQAWIEEMAGFIKSIDANHLVSTGEEGWYAGINGTDYIRNNQSPNIDICSFHLLMNDMGFSEEYSLQWIDQHIDDAHLVINKPVYCGEIGVQVVRNASNAAAQMAARNRIYSDWYDEFLARVIDGGGFWLLSADRYLDYDYYTVYYPQDTETCAIISDFSNAMADLREK